MTAAVSGFVEGYPIVEPSMLRRTHGFDPDVSSLRIWVDDLASFKVVEGNAGLGWSSASAAGGVIHRLTSVLFQEEDQDIHVQRMHVSEAERFVVTGDEPGGFVTLSLLDDRCLWGRGFLRIYRFNVPGEPKTFDRTLDRDELGDLRGPFIPLRPEGSPRIGGWALDDILRYICSRLGHGHRVSRVPLMWTTIKQPHFEFEPFASAGDALRAVLKKYPARVCLMWDNTVAFFQDGEGEVGQTSGASDSNGGNSLALPPEENENLDGYGAVDAAEFDRLPKQVVVVGGERYQTLQVLLIPVISVFGQWFPLEIGLFLLNQREHRPYVDWDYVLRSVVDADENRRYLTPYEQAVAKDAFVFWRVPDPSLLPIMPQADRDFDGVKEGARLAPVAATLRYRLERRLVNGWNRTVVAENPASEAAMRLQMLKEARSEIRRLRNDILCLEAPQTPPPAMPLPGEAGVPKIDGPMTSVQCGPNVRPGLDPKDGDLPGMGVWSPDALIKNLDGTPMEAGPFTNFSAGFYSLPKGKSIPGNIINGILPWTMAWEHPEDAVLNQGLQFSSPGLYWGSTIARLISGQRAATIRWGKTPLHEALDILQQDYTNALNALDRRLQQSGEGAAFAEDMREAAFEAMALVLPKEFIQEYFSADDVKHSQAFSTYSAEWESYASTRLLKYEAALNDLAKVDPLAKLRIDFAAKLRALGKAIRTQLPPGGDLTGIPLLEECRTASVDLILAIQRVAKDVAEGRIPGDQLDEAIGYVNDTGYRIDPSLAIVDAAAGIVRFSGPIGVLDHEGVPSLAGRRLQPTKPMLRYGTRIRARSEAVEKKANVTSEEFFVQAFRFDGTTAVPIGQDEVGDEALVVRDPDLVEFVSLPRDPAPPSLPPGALPGQATTTVQIGRMPEPRPVKVINEPGSLKPESNRDELVAKAKELAEAARAQWVFERESWTRVYLRPRRVNCNGIVSSVEIELRPGNMGFRTTVRAGRIDKVPLLDRAPRRSLRDFFPRTSR